jgi:hypothetical protein
MILLPVLLLEGQPLFPIHIYGWVTKTILHTKNADKAKRA